MTISQRLPLIIYSFTHFFIYSFAFAQAPKTYTSSEILLQLKKLNTVGAVLYIAAHPDDENTRLISYLANEKCLRTGYLSLTRGDGGQNLIGPEQGIELGVIRTQELLAARRIDGGEQFFTRAYDFGFSKSPEETFTKWNRDSILGDMVWVIRNFRPDIIITRFATDGSGGHGHHTASAILAEEAFDAAADPTRFPEQLKYVSVWKTRRMFHNSTARFFNPNADLSHLIKLDVGGYNPLLGKSYGEIAAESRSMHKSQGFGSARQRGESFEYFKPVKGDTAGLKDIFEGIDFSWKRNKGSELIGSLIESKIKEITQRYNIEKPEASVKDLQFLRKLVQQVDYIKARQLDQIIYACSGLFIENTTTQPVYAEKDTIEYAITSINRSQTIVVLNTAPMPLDPLSFNLNIKDNYINNHLSHDTLKTNNLNTIKRKGIPLKYEEKSWLENGIQQNMFNPTDYLNRQTPQKLSQIVSTIPFSVNDQPFVETKELVYKSVDPEKGELYRPLVITPPVMLNMASGVLAFNNTKSKDISVIVKAGKDKINGNLKLEAPANWKIEPASIAFEILKKGDEKTIQFKVTPPATAHESTLTAVAEINGERFTKGIKEIKYDHIPVQTLFPEAKVKLVKLDIVKKSKSIGYIPGAGDEVQACLTQLGYEVVTLTDDKLVNEDLKQYDAIITGVRAYNTNEKLPSFKQKLMDYVNNGGNLIVQYNTNSWAGPLSSDIGPYKFKITRNRITDEEAKVNMLIPNHPVFNTPNKITEKDFEGWIQERSIYHAGEWDSVNFVAPISMTDPYEMTVGNVSPKGKPDNGALIIGKYGKGNFIYTGLVFFRELPAGVPGAYRLMVNLIELGK